MPGGYRIAIVAALAGLVFIAFGTGFYVASLPSQKNELHQSYGYANEDGQKPPVSKAGSPKAEQNRTPCVNPQSVTESDLCAQWRAAKATEKAADWTLLGVLATMLGTAFLLWQIMLTREAVEDTGKATQAMLDANKITKDNSHRELRAYISTKSMTLRESEWEDDVFYLTLEICNHGQTPALVQKIILQAWWISENANGLTGLIDHQHDVIFKSHRDTPIGYPLSFKGGFDRHEHRGHIYVVGTVKYRDAFGKMQSDAFGWQTPPDSFNPFYEIEMPCSFHSYSVEALINLVDKSKLNKIDK